MTVLRVDGLRKRFGGLVAVNGISFSVAGGEILGLIGPNGSGKSTVMKLIMGIERPDEGRVFVGDTDVAGWPAHRVARAGVGIVFQHARPLMRQTVVENILLALLPDRLTAIAAAPHLRERAEAIARRVGLGEVLDRTPGTLAFADLRRLEMAKAVARDPAVVLVDEPFAGLTPGEVAQFSDILRGFRADGHAVLLVDHNVKSVASLSDRVFAMYLGERIAEGTADAVMRDPTVRRVYLGGDIAREEPVRAVAGAALLDVRGVSVSYGRARALRDVSLRVGEGECVSVVGLNGAGKTTLFNACSGMVAYEGSVVFGGEAREGVPAAAIARAGLVQCSEGRDLFGDMTVAENLRMGGQHLAAGEAASRTEWLCGLFPILRARAKQAARTLSGGEQQMLAIARALMMKPRLLILDEPTLGLAPVILEQLSHALTALRRTTDIAVLLGEQNVTFALPHADRVYVLEQGAVVWEGAPDAFAAERGAEFL